jgi:putative Mg2+ transporter-C (MgtC) family protein
VGIRFWFAAIVGAAAALIVLALFRYIEARLPSEFYAHHMIRFARDHVLSEEEVHRLIHGHGFTIANLSSRLSESGPQLGTVWRSKAATARTRARCLLIFADGLR